MTRPSPHGDAATAEAPMHSAPFLTDTQRAALDAALATKAAEVSAQVAAQAKAAVKTTGVGDRKSRSGKGTGEAKKGGGGGKFTWGSVMTDRRDAEGILDKQDPNYDSDEERCAADGVQQARLRTDVQMYKEEVMSIIEEYFTSGDIGEVVESLEELAAPHLAHYFVKRLVTCACDGKDSTRERASVLLSSLYGVAVTSNDVQRGFMDVVEMLDDLKLDVPDVADVVAAFVARAVIDDVLPPAFVQRIPNTEGSTTAALRHKADALLGARHCAEKILRIWGAGAGVQYQDTKDSIAKLLTEFVSSGDAEEARRCLFGLSVPFFHHELVKQALHLAIAKPQSREQIVDLLGRLSASGEVSSLQLSKGVARVSENLDDLALDDPQARDAFASVLQMCRESGISEAHQADASASSSSGGAHGNGVANGGGGASGGASSHSIAAFKSAANAALREYFVSKDAQEVARRLTELDDPGLLHIFVKHAVTLAMDRKDRERELVSQLLANLHPKVLGPEAVAGGFTRLLLAADDLALDVPDAVHLLGLFLGRAVVDEVLPPAYLVTCLPTLEAAGQGVAVVKAAGTLLGARHGSERLTKCWHGGALSLLQIKEEIGNILQEYLTSQDVGEASRCLRELSVPYYHHELVRETLELSFEQPQNAPALLGLLAQLAGTGQINQTQMTSGFDRIRLLLSQEALDYPHAQEQFDDFVALATRQGWLTAPSQPPPTGLAPGDATATAAEAPTEALATASLS